MILTYLINSYLYMSKHAGQNWKPLANPNKKNHVKMKTGGWDQYFIKRINILQPPQSDLSLREVIDGVHNPRTRRTEPLHRSRRMF